MGVALTFFLLFVVIAGVSLQENLPSLVVSGGEVFALPLASYFDGNNLSFSLSTNATQNVQLDDPFKLTLQTTITYSSANTYDGSTPKNVLLDSFSIKGQTYLLNAVSGDMQAYSVSAVGVPKFLWKYSMPGNGAVTVLRVTHIFSQGKVFALALVSNTVGKATNYDVYLFDISNLAVPPPSNILLELLAASSAIPDILTMSTSTQNFLIVNEFSFLQVYSIASLTSITQLVDITSYEDGTALAAVQIAAGAGDKLYVLDAHKGLVSFQFHDQEFSQATQVSITPFGSPTFLESCGSSSLAAGTTNGLLIVDSTTDTLTRWIPIQLANNVWVPYSAFCSGNYVIVTVELNSVVTLVVLDLALPSSSIVQKQWSLPTPNGFVIPFAMYAFVPLHTPQTFAYFRSDEDALYVSQSAVGKLRVTGKSSATNAKYSATVIASEVGASGKVSVNSTLVVQYADAMSKTVLFGTGLKLSSVGQPLTTATEVVGSFGEARIPVSSLFSGPGLNFTITMGDMPAGVTICSYFEKISVQSLVPPSQVMTDGVLLAAANGRLYVRTNQYVKNTAFVMYLDYNNGALYLSGGRGYSGFVPTSLGIDSTYGMIMLGSYSQVLQLRMSRSPKDYQVNVTLDCFEVKVFGGYAFCVSPGHIDVFSIPDLILSYSITPAMLGLAKLQVADIVFQNFADQSSILYVSCMVNGLLAVDISTLSQTPANLPVWLGLASATSGAYLCLPTLGTLAQVNRDGSLLVLDVSKGPAMRFLRTIPNWGSGSLCGFTNTDSFVVVCAGGKLLFYDVQNAVHAALYSTYAIGANCGFQASGSQVFTLCQSNFTSLTPLGTWGAAGFEYTFNVSFGFDFSQFQEPSYDIAINLLGFSTANTQSLPVSLPVSLTVPNNGITYNSSLDAVMNIHSDESSVFNLSSVFSGQQIEFELEINGQSRSCPDVNATDPVVLKPTFERSGHGFGNPRHSFDSFALLEIGGAVTIYKSIMQLWQMSLNTYDGCQQDELFTTQGEFDLSSMIGGLDSCPLVSVVAQTAKNELVAAYCRGSLGNNSLNFFYITRNQVSLAGSQPLSIRPTLLKTRPTPEGHFLIALTDGEWAIQWGEFLWNAGSNVKFVMGLVQVDSASLGLTEFYPEDVDMEAAISGAVIYVADKDFGVRLLTYSAATGSVTLDSSFQLTAGVTGLSLCFGGLYVLQPNASLVQFQLADGTGTLEIARTVTDFNTEQETFTPLSASLACSTRQRLLAARMVTIGGYGSVRVFDLLADVGSEILGTLRFTIPNSDSQGIDFDDNGHLSVLNTVGFFIFQVNRPYLYFPALSRSQYKSMVKIWGSHDFEIRLTASNGCMQLNTSTVALSREWNGSESIWSEYWWVWGILGVALVVGVGGLFLYCRSRRIKRRKDQELLPTTQEPLPE